MNYPQFWKEASLRRKRIYSVIFVLILSIIATLVGMLVPLSPQEAQLIVDQLNRTVTENTAQGTLIPAIFINNFSLCLLMFIPLIGLAIGLFILFSTGMAFRAIFDAQAASGLSGATTQIEASTAILALALIGVVFLLEYVSYSIGMTESIWLFRRLLQNRWKGELKYLAIFIGIVALLLIVGAIVETYTLSLGL
ncbi:MAG: stage II sporulation protein M [Candidatus Bathyarchaeota archaeon]|nr:stage II sporulation protein M [Candidatus Bathyarchaeota archaeon]